MNASLPPFPCLLVSEHHDAVAVPDDAAFLRIAEDAARRGPAVLLLSGGAHDCSRRSFLFSEPVAMLRSKDGCSVVTTRDGSTTLEQHPLDALDALFAAIAGDGRGAADSGPWIAGYAAYELKNGIERLPQNARDELGLPDLCFIVPSRVLVHDRSAGTLRTHVFRYGGAGGGTLTPLLSAPAARVAEGPAAAQSFTSSSFSRDAYEDAVRRARRHIINGDIYQINLSQRFTGTFIGDAFAYWKRLFVMNPAPFYAWVHAGDHLILSTSMERFLQRSGDALESRPIKGTRARAASAGEDERVCRQLLDSPKDDAELSMIVDLIRNDLGRVCMPGSVTVAQHKRLESFANVHHLVSVVHGRQKAGTSLGDLFRAAFPGGSITGCPRIRAMELIDAFEPVARHAYTGSIGYACANGDADFSIAIRTMILRDGRFHLSLGGGIVHDSDPAAEYEETMDKGRTFFAAGLPRDGDQETR